MQADKVREGVRNLVNQCAEVQRGESVLILNEASKIDPEIADLIVDLQPRDTAREIAVQIVEGIPGHEM